MAKRFVFVITDAQHEALEAYRASHRLRSMGEAARHMIEATVSAPRYEHVEMGVEGVTEPDGSLVLRTFGPRKAQPGELLKKPKR